MKKLSIYFMALLATVVYTCSSDDSPSTTDLEAPEFVAITRPRMAGDGVIPIRGEMAEVRSESSTHFHIRGTVTDNVGLSELRVDVHGTHDGHTHGRNGSLLPEYRVDHVIDLGGVTEFTFDDPDFPNNILYYDTENFRAGPYDVILHAVDLAGNATSFSNGRSVNRMIYLRRPYQPSINITGDANEAIDELEFEPGDALAIDGWIEQNRGADQLAFPVTFVRISIVEDEHGHSHNHGRSADADYEAIWGTSNYLTSPAGAPLSGDALPDFNNNQLNYNTLFALKPYTLSEANDHKTLRIEVEDAGGNLAVREFELEVHD